MNVLFTESASNITRLNSSQNSNILIFIANTNVRLCITFIQVYNQIPVSQFVLANVSPIVLHSCMC